MEDENRESTWQCILRLHDPNEAGFADPGWFDAEELEFYFGDDPERRMADFRTLLELGVIIKDAQGRYIINLWWDQGPGLLSEQEVQPPKRSFLNSR